MTPFTFRYPWFAMAFTFAIVPPSCPFFLYQSYRAVTTGASVFTCVMMAFLAASSFLIVWQLLANPRELSFSSGVLTARYYSGKRRSWRVDELRRADKDFLTEAVGGVAFLDRQGRVQFRVWQKIGGYRNLLGLIPD